MRGRVAVVFEPDLNPQARLTCPDVVLGSWLGNADQADDA